VKLRNAAITFVLVVAACGNGKVNAPTDAFVERPVIDPAPYYTVCNAQTPCTAPYECTVPDLAHDPVDNVCLVPCTGSEQCPDGHICNGQSMTIMEGASNHCIALP
jgi:hypothetical protein